MSTVVDLFPPLGLTIEAGPLVLRGITDDILVDLCDLAAGGIHDPTQMPFYFPWTNAPADELTRNTAAYHWGARATSPRGLGPAPRGRSTRGGWSAPRASRPSTSR